MIRKKKIRCPGMSILYGKRHLSRKKCHLSCFFLPISGVLISRMTLQQPLSSGLKWTTGVHVDPHTTLDYEFRLVCSTHYYGSDCDTFCRPRDDQFGHYTCGPKGEKICLNGYEKDPNNPEGDYCTQGKQTFFMSIPAPLYQQWLLLNSAAGTQFPLFYSLSL